jgi:molybdopterin-guanine dinucleotide biosynthesis protein
VSIDIRGRLNGHAAAFPGPAVVPLLPQRLLEAKYAYTTRHVQRVIARQPRGYFLRADPDQRPRPGDVLLAEVVELGHHRRLESPAGRRALMFPGDEIVVAYGHRYAPDQFEARVPDDLGEAHLVAAGGVVGLVTATKDGVDDPTVVRPLGLVHDTGGAVSLAGTAPFTPRAPLDLAAPGERRSGRPRVVALVGTSMNSGKSTALACVVRGLTRSGLRVGAGKATGTGAGGDPGMYRDAGAGRVLDFTDFGHVSTYRLGHEDVRAVFASLVSELSAPGVDVVAVEIADGAYQAETARLLADPVFAEYVDEVLFTAVDALSAVAGVAEMRRHGVGVAAVTGRITSAPLATREARAALDLPVVDTLDLCEPEVAICLLPTADGALR